MKYRVKNWREFQHYKDRNPPWIKLHFSVLSSQDWVTLDDASRVLAIACMLIASRSDGEIDGSEGGLAYIKRVAYLNKVPNLKPLIDCGFLECASDCKQMLADARPETETETEKKHHIASSDKSLSPDAVRKGALNGEAVEVIPLIGGKEWGVPKEFLAELEKAYPIVDGPATLREIRAWCVANPTRCKTEKGIPRFINSWFGRIQDRGR